LHEEKIMRLQEGQPALDTGYTVVPKESSWLEGYIEASPTEEELQRWRPVADALAAHDSARLSVALTAAMTASWKDIAIKHRLPPKPLLHGYQAILEACQRMATKMDHEWSQNETDLGGRPINGLA
jgi:hypothetical protein